MIGWIGLALSVVGCAGLGVIAWAAAEFEAETDIAWESQGYWKKFAEDLISKMDLSQLVDVHHALNRRAGGAG